MSTDKEKEKAKQILRDQREKDRLEKEKERLARVEKLQRAASQHGGGGGTRGRSSVNDDDGDPDSDADAEDAAASKREYFQRIVQLWKEKPKKPPKPGGSVESNYQIHPNRSTPRAR